jgi:peptide/nickel transport system substrate-binding protein
MNDMEQLNALVANGKLSRREFVSRASALGVGSSLGGLLLAGEAAAQTKKTPKKGGTLRVGMEGGSASDSLDPRTYADSIMIAASLTLMNGFIEIGNDGKAKGELLESWSTKPGATEWVFNVRKGIKFTSGKTLDADDILYSLSLHMGDTKSPAKGLLKQIKEMKKLSPTQVQFTLESGNADFPSVLSDYHLVVTSNGWTDWTKPDGTGAFTLEKFEPGVRITFKNKGSYWKPGRGNFDAVEILYINDKAARTAALQSGKIDAANRLDARTVNLLAKNPKLNIVRTKGSGNRYCFVSHVTAAPYNNKDLRTALKFGIDRKKIIDTVFNGFASVGNDHTLDANNPFYNKKMAQRAYDPDKAAFHFKRSGVATSDLELLTSEGAWGSAVDCASIYQESLKKAGIQLKVKKVAADGYWSDVWLKQPFCAAYWGSRPTADVALSTTFKSDAEWNDTKWKNAEFDKLILEARVELNEAKRSEMYARAQEIVADDGGMVCFAISDYLDGYAKNVMGNDPHPRYDLADDRIAETGWFA